MAQIQYSWRVPRVQRIASARRRRYDEFGIVQKRRFRKSNGGFRVQRFASFARPTRYDEQHHMPLLHQSCAALASANFMECVFHWWRTPAAPSTAMAIGWMPVRFAMIHLSKCPSRSVHANVGKDIQPGSFITLQVVSPLPQHKYIPHA